MLKLSVEKYFSYYAFTLVTFYHRPKKLDCNSLVPVSLQSLKLLYGICPEFNIKFILSCFLLSKHSVFQSLIYTPQVCIWLGSQSLYMALANVRAKWFAGCMPAKYESALQDTFIILCSIYLNLLLYSTVYTHIIL